MRVGAAARCAFAGSVSLCEPTSRNDQIIIISAGDMKGKVLALVSHQANLKLAPPLS